MTPFELARPNVVAEVGGLLTSNGSATRVVAGGTDLLTEIKEGVIRPQTLVGMDRLAELYDYDVGADGLLLGAMTTLARIEHDPAISAGYPALAQAAASIATPQIRNVGTLGGNLCQRPRCWYYRSTQFHCLKKGGDICFAQDEGNKYHAVIGGGNCHIVHPSDMAVALITLRAEVSISGPSGPRKMQLEDFFAGPEKDIAKENVLQTDEILAHVHVPPPRSGRRSVYLKAKERQAYDFALVSVALALEVNNGTVSRARLTLGGVAPVPLRCIEVEEALNGVRATDVDSVAIGELAVHGARPLKDNGYKVPLASALVRRALAYVLRIDG